MAKAEVRSIFVGMGDLDTIVWYNENSLLDC